MRILLFILLFSAQTISAQNLTIEAVRKEYHKAASDSSTCASLYAKTQKDNSSDNLLIGYKGAVSATMANYVKTKSEKLKLFNSGKKLIEQSIAADASNIELRFLRFTIQTNCPKALGYNDKISEDKKLVLANIASLKNAALRKKMISFLSASSYLTEAEKKSLPSDK
jgi:hypothetical protein